jgi:hypothetical protein
MEQKTPREWAPATWRASQASPGLNPLEWTNVLASIASRANTKGKELKRQFVRPRKSRTDVGATVPPAYSAMPRHLRIALTNSLLFAIAIFHCIYIAQ